VSAFAYGDTTHPTYATKTTSPQGNIINFAYDANGNACAKSEGDLAGLTLTCTNLVGNDPVKFVYNTDGTIATATDARGKITSYGYDSLGRLTSITFPSPLGGVSFTYDSLNRVRTFTNGKGQVTTYGYDNLDRLKTIAYAGSGTITFNYDSDDNVQSRVDSNGNKTTSYFYDQLNRLTEADYPSGAVVKYGYDGVGNLTSFTDGTQTVGYGYDDAERLTTLTEPNGQQTTFGYDNDNNRTLVTYPSATGVTIAMTYDDLDRVKTVLAQKGATRYVDLTYAHTIGVDAYDGSGNRCRSYVGTAPFAGSFDCSATGSGVTAYTYNDANELTAVGATSYGYDLNGNETGPSGGLLLDYNDRDQTSNMTPPGGNSFGIVYDGPGQWERAQVGSQTSFVNSQLGVSSSGSTYWTRDNGGQLLEQRTSTGNDYYLFDGQGSILGLIDASGNLVGNFSYRYDPYGQQLNSEPTGYPSNSWRFQGQYLDANVGLYKMGQRYYDPATGRWTQRDPLDNALDTHGWNRYDYAGDDPVNSVDPSGMCWTGLCWIKHTYNALAGAQAWTESVLGRYGSACLWGAIQGATVGAITGAAAGGVGAAPGAATGAVEGCSAGVAIRLAATLSEKAAATGEAAAFIHDVFELVNASKE
jgi:RHS repeat-associated protein